MDNINYAIIGIAFIFLMTTLGSSLVFFKRKKKKSITENLCLGFAGGVMLAASFFSLLIPSFTYSEMLNIAHAIPAAIGIILGSIFILVFDIIISHRKDNQNLNYRDKKLFIAVTIHNIPEGLSVGLTFGLALSHYDNITILSGVIFALGIGIQNFPEGAALSLPLYESLGSKTKAFLLASLSGLVEPIFGVLGLLLATKMVYLMPWALCFGAGAMIYVIIDELIIYSSHAKEKRLVNLSFIFGFIIMMVLDLCF